MVAARTRRVAIGALAALAASLVAAAAPAPAATRWATPGGGDIGTCTFGNPACSIQRALQVAETGDTVMLTYGQYGSYTSPLTAVLRDNGDAITIIGQRNNDQIAPTIWSEALGAAFSLDAAGSELRDVRIFSLGGDALHLHGARAENVHARGGTACRLWDAGARLVSSFCDGGAGTGVRVGNITDGYRHAEIRNVTAYGAPAIDVLAWGNGDTTDDSLVKLNASNTIAWGAPDIRVRAELGGDVAEVILNHSNYADVEEVGAGTTTVTPTTIYGNQSAPPVWRDVTIWPGQQGAGSPTIDAGALDATADPFLDFKGWPRVIDDSIDIGADEFQTPPDVVTRSATGLTQTSATLRGTVEPKRVAASWRFDWGTTTAYGRSTPTATLTTVGEQPVTATVSGLEPGRTYHARLVAWNRWGQRTGNDVTFTTARPPAPAVPSGAVAAPPPATTAPSAASPRAALDLAPRVSQLRIKPKTLRITRRTRARITYRLSTAATVTFTVRKRVGRRWQAVRGKLRHVGRPGVNRLVFRGRMRGRALRPGRYRLVAVARDRAGRRSVTVRVAFRVARRR